MQIANCKVAGPEMIPRPISQLVQNYQTPGHHIKLANTQLSLQDPMCKNPMSSCRKHIPSLPSLRSQKLSNSQDESSYMRLHGARLSTACSWMRPPSACSLGSWSHWTERNPCNECFAMKHHETPSFPLFSLPQQRHAIANCRPARSRP